MPRRLLLCAALVLTLAACRQEEPPPPPPPQPTPTPLPLPTPLPPLPTIPPLGSEPDPLVVMLPAEAPDLAEILASESDAVIVVEVAAAPAQIRAALCDGSAHLVVLDALATIAATSQNCGEVLAVAERDNAVAQQAELVTPVVGGVFSPLAFQGREVCRTDPLSVTGWVVPGLYWQTVGLDPFSQFSAVIDVRDEDELIEAMLEGECTGGAVSSEVLADLEEPESIRSLAELPPVPYEAVVIAEGLPTDLDALLRTVFDINTSLFADVVNADEWVEPDPELYEPLTALLLEAGLDPAVFGNAP